MRERTTWNKDNILKASQAKTAEDPTAMNQDHIQRQPPADKYLTGDPSTFAEDVHPSAKNWKAEYNGDGTTSRNEIGMPETRDDTFNHPEKDPGSSPARGGGGRQAATLDEETLVKKADLCCKVARQILGPKAVEAAVEDQALALMGMSDSDLIATVNRMAQQDEGQQQGQQAQDKQAQLPPEFIENMEKKKEEAKDKDDKEKEAAQAADKQAQLPDFIKEKIEEKKEEDKKEDKKEAGQKVGQLEQMAQQIQQMAQQIQQMQAQQQGPAQQQQEQQAQQQGQQQEQQALDQMLQQQSNDQMIDQMLQQPAQMTANTEIGVQLGSSAMDIGEVTMTPEDDVLTTLFANNTEVQNAQKAHTLQYGAPAPMQVQASPMTRTASGGSRTIGTRPTAGVSTIGGLGSPAPSASGGDVEKLSSLWNSAPDVSDVFRS